VIILLRMSFATNSHKNSFWRSLAPIIIF